MTTLDKCSLLRKKDCFHLQLGGFRPSRQGRSGSRGRRKGAGSPPVPTVRNRKLQCESPAHFLPLIPLRAQIRGLPPPTVKVGLPISTNTTWVVLHRYAPGFVSKVTPDLVKFTTDIMHPRYQGHSVGERQVRQQFWGNQLFRIYVGLCLIWASLRDWMDRLN